MNCKHPKINFRSTAGAMAFVCAVCGTVVREHDTCLANPAGTVDVCTIPMSAVEPDPPPHQRAPTRLVEISVAATTITSSTSSSTFTVLRYPRT